MRKALMLSALMLAVAAIAAAEMTNAKLETASAATGLEAEARRIAGRPGATWMAYDLPMASTNDRRQCGGNSPHAFLEPAATFSLLARFEGGRVVRIRTFTPECEIDAGGMPVVRLTGVNAGESVSWLAQLASGGGDGTSTGNAIAIAAVNAIALHATPAAPTQLLHLAQTSSDPDVRKRAIGVLTSLKDPEGIRLLREFLSPK